jgi:glycosyltransferase involved in cell wall biosynthesis
MKIIAMLRVRNEARWIGEVLSSIHPLTRDIVVFDDNSNDGTPDICGEMGAAVLHSPFRAGDTDEARDKNLLLEAISGSGADYVLSIDGDELLQPGAAPLIRASLKPGISSLLFPIRYLWNDRRHYRADGVYGRYRRASLFALQPGARFRSTAYGCNFHCGNIPVGLVGTQAFTQAEILHLGYMHREDRIRKYRWYNERDPNNTSEDQYRHICIGDLPEFPPESVFLHGGPLKVFTLPANLR